MLSLRSKSILALALATSVIGATLPGLAGHAAAAPTAPQLAATMQGNILHLTGSNLVPGSKVRFAVMRSDTWNVLFRATAYAEPAYIPEPYYYNVTQSPKAGTIDLTLPLRGLPAAANLRVLFKTAHLIGMLPIKAIVQAAPAPCSGSGKPAHMQTC